VKYLLCCSEDTNDPKNWTTVQEDSEFVAVQRYVDQQLFDMEDGQVVEVLSKSPDGTVKKYHVEAALTFCVWEAEEPKPC
jgi:hypothetical protein